MTFERGLAADAKRQWRAFRVRATILEYASFPVSALYSWTDRRERPVIAARHSRENKLRQGKHLWRFAFPVGITLAAAISSGGDAFDDSIQPALHAVSLSPVSNSRGSNSNGSEDASGQLRTLGVVAKIGFNAIDDDKQLALMHELGVSVVCWTPDERGTNEKQRGKYALRSSGHCPAWRNPASNRLTSSESLSAWTRSLRPCAKNSRRSSGPPARLGKDRTLRY